MNWDIYEKREEQRIVEMLRGIPDRDDAIKTAAESMAHWNRMYRELLEEYATTTRPACHKGLPI